MPEVPTFYSRSRWRQRGTVTIEFMVVAPILLLLLLGISEFGHALYQSNTLTKSVRDGARYLSSVANGGSGGSSVIEAIDATETVNLVVYGNTAGGGSPVVPGLTASHISLSCLGCATTGSPDHVVVRAQWPYQSILGGSLPTFGFGADLPLGFTVTTSATMRVL